MVQHEKISLAPEQETLLIPLYCKGSGCGSLFDDVKARDILSQLDFDFQKLKIPGKTCVMMCLRARQFDAYAREFVDNRGNATIVHLGCGLDSRCGRLNCDSLDWYDLDVPEVIGLRRRFYSETDKYHLIASSVTDLAWMTGISPGNSPVLVIAEGLFMYLSAEEVKSLVIALSHAFPGCHLIFDAFGTRTARSMAAHPSIRQTGAKVRWGIDDPHQIEQWDSHIRLREERGFAHFNGVEHLSAVYRFAFALSDLLPAVRRAHRILHYTL